LVLVIALVQGFLFINAVALWGPDWPSEGALIYIALEAIFLGWLGQSFLPRESVLRGLFLWILGFILTWAAVYALFTYGFGYKWPSLPAAQAAPLLFYTIFFVAPVEELIFRGVLPAEVEGREPWKRVPVLLLASQGLFAVFHFAAYGGWAPVPMALAFILGVVWVYASKRWTLFFTMGSHAAYNLLVLGILSGGIT
jgi:membrane protease YdiL (CAAX protease family)